MADLPLDTSSTTSVSDSIRQYRELHGRTYHNFGDTEYWGPNDEVQNEQLDIGHHMCTLILDNKLYLAPLTPEPQKVLDVGCGTGIWAIDFADEHPSATVIGTDISPIQPSWIPPNLRFEIDDVQLDWVYPSNDFDFVHIRHMLGSISNWPLLYERAFRCIKPGGYIQHIDFCIQFLSDEGALGPGHPLYEWSALFLEAGETMGQTFRTAEKAKKLLEVAGFEDVVENKWKVPVGAWMEDPKWKEIGDWCLLYLTTGLEGMALYILKNILGWTYLEIQVLVAKTRAALLKTHHHAYSEIYLVYGRKPEKKLEKKPEKKPEKDFEKQPVEEPAKISEPNTMSEPEIDQSKEPPSDQKHEKAS